MSLSVLGGGAIFIVFTSSSLHKGGRMAQETIDLTPNTEGLVRWIRHVAETDRPVAVRLMQAGWPKLKDYEIYIALDGEDSDEEVARHIGGI